MSRYILDTDICVEIMRGNPKVVDRFHEVGRRNCTISEITMAELKFGEEKSLLKGFCAHNYSIIENYLSVFPLRPVFSLFAKNKAYLESVGKRIEDFDLLIASTAQYCDGILVTGNKKHMGHVQGIKIEDWIRGE